MMAFFILCLLATLSAVESLTCEDCYGTAGYCQPSQTPCTASVTNGGCITVAEENTLAAGGTKTSALYKGCITDSYSGIKAPISFTVGNGKYVRINTAKCNDRDNCNSAILDVPKENTNLNGLQCPTCFALNSDPCDSQITPCRGNENYCIDFAGWLMTRSNPPSTSTFAAKGCGTASTQDIKAVDTLQSPVTTYTFTKATSKPATSGGSQTLGKFSFALYLPGLCGLLLVKLLH